jgi:hypothetical protein
MVDFYDIFYNLQGSGFYEFFLPFILIFAIIYAVLEKVKLFTREDAQKQKVANTPANIIIALIVGLLLVNQFQIVAALNSFIPAVSFWLVVIVMFLIIIGLFGVGIHNGFSGAMLLFFTIVGIVVIYAALAPALNFQLPYWVSDNPALIAMGVIFLVVIFAMTGTFKSGSDKNEQPWEMMMNRMFGKGNS